MQTNDAAFGGLRMAHIVYRLLTNPRGWRVDDLCERLKLKDRTYRKYRLQLQRFFQPFHREGGSMVCEVREGEVRYLRLVQEPDPQTDGVALYAEFSAIYLARLLLRFTSSTELGSVLDNLWAQRKNKSRHLPQVLHLTKNIDRLFHQIPYAEKAYHAHAAVLKVLINALVGSFEVRFFYQSANSTPHHVTVQPHTLVVYRGGLYLLAVDASLVTPRYYAIDRIENCELTHDSFDYPEPNCFHPNRFSEGCFGLFKTNDSIDTTYDVDLVFAEKRWLQMDLMERTWHPSQRFDKLDDGRLRMAFRVNSLVEVVPWVRSYGPDVEVFAPQSLKLQVGRFVPFEDLGAEQKTGDAR